MSDDNFIYKSYCELIISSEIIGPDEITDELRIQPIRSFRKGGKVESKYSTRTGVKKKGLWAFRTKEIVSGNESISLHIQELQRLLVKREGKIISYKNDINIEVCIWIWIETDNAGVGLELNEEEQTFLNNISNRIHFSFICKNTIEDGV